MEKNNANNSYYSTVYYTHRLHEQPPPPRSTVVLQHFATFSTILPTTPNHKTAFTLLRSLVTLSWTMIDKLSEQAAAMLRSVGSHNKGKQKQQHHRSCIVNTVVADRPDTTWWVGTLLLYRTLLVVVE